MRTPDDLPRRGRERRPSPMASQRSRILLGVVIAALVILLLSLRGIAGVYTDYLWFDSLDQGAVWRGLLGARIFLGVVFILLFFAMAWANFYVADRLAPPFRPAGPEDELLERYHELVAGRMHWIRLVVAGLLAVIAGAGASSEWNSWILFRHGGTFGIDDPQFNSDVGFYMFQLPFLSFVVDWLFASLLIILIITAVAHYLNGGIRVQTQAPRVSPQVKAHLSLLLAGLALIRAVDYWLQRFELTVSSQGVVDGVSYTDSNAQLPALNLLVLISLAAAGLFIFNIFRRGWTLPVVAVALWGVVAVVVGGVYPAYVQRFQVEPNESVRETELMERNMEATRFALGLDGIRTEPFSPRSTPANEVDLSGYEPTVRNIRLWDPSDAIALQAYQQLQQIRAYYEFTDIDVGRYEMDGEMTGVGVGLRTVDGSRIPISGWEGRHLAYTHGYGAVLAPSGATDDREPEFLTQDIPQRSVNDSLPEGNPQVYFSEDLSGYVMTGTGRDEIDYETDEETVITEYDGEDGVGAGSLLRRTAFALRFGDINPIISGFMSGDTRVHYIRDVRERVETLAPFLHTDADPYPVLLEDRTVWVLDMYTTSDRFPYGQRANVDELAGDSGLRHNFNYVRNSVKAVVDAYDGTVSFYIVDDEDPIVAAYDSAFPGLFSDGTPESDGGEMPDDLVPHLRYPEDLFRTQTIAWQRYHLQEVDKFYSQGDRWNVAIDPGTVGGEGTTPVTDASGEIVDRLEARIPPYYQVLQLPGEQEPEFAMLRPFVPFSEDDQRQQLSALMVARSDPEHYGELIVYQMPTGDLPDGPGIAAANIRSNEDVSRIETFLGQAGSRVHYGNLLLLPLGDSTAFVDEDGFVLADTGGVLEDEDGTRVMVEEDTTEDGEPVARLVDEDGDPVSIEEGGQVVDEDGNVLEDEDGEPLVTGLALDETGNVMLDEEGNLPRGGITGDLVYVQPFYVEPEDRRLPALRFVIVYYGGEVVIEGTLQEALEAIFGEQVETLEDPETLGEELTEAIDDAGLEDVDEADEPDPADEAEEADEPETEISDDLTADELVQQAWDALDEAAAALDEGDLGTYQEKGDEAQDLLEEALDRNRAETEGDDEDE
jgi:uncharacterized protein